MKYLIEVFDNNNGCSFESNSRNSRKHLMQHEATLVNVYDFQGELVSRAQRLGKDMILVGARKVAKK